VNRSTTSPDHVQSLAIADAKTGKVLWGHQEADKLDIASTTKMMTAYIVCQLAKDDPRVLTDTITFFRIRRPKPRVQQPTFASANE